MELDFDGNLHYVKQFVVAKRGDKCCPERLISQVKFEYSVDGSTWLQYNNGEIFETGQLVTDDINVFRTIDFTPFQATKVKFIVPVSPTNHRYVHGRFEYMLG